MNYNYLLLISLIVEIDLKILRNLFSRYPINLVQIDYEKLYFLLGHLSLKISNYLS